MRQRACHCDRYTLDEPFVRGRDCARCWRWHHDPDYRAGRPVNTSAVSAAPCIHRGDELTAARCQAIGVDPRKRWYRCERGVQLQEYPAGVVCSCAGCGPRCSGYEAATD